MVILVYSLLDTLISRRNIWIWTYIWTFIHHSKMVSNNLHRPIYHINNSSHSKKSLNFIYLKIAIIK